MTNAQIKQMAKGIYKIINKKENGEQLTQLEIGILTKLSYGANADDLTEKEQNYLMEI